MINTQYIIIMPIISIEGNIGSGKSSILNRLEKKYNTIQEDVETWKKEGWLSLFYSDIARYASTFQLRTQLSHIENKNKFIDGINIVERSPVSNKYIFGKMLMEDKFLHEKEYNLIDQVNNLIGWTPDMLIVLLCDPEVCYERIKKRNRDGENIPGIKYLQALHEKHLALKHLAIPVHYIDTTNKTIDEVETLTTLFIENEIK